MSISRRNVLPALAIAAAGTVVASGEVAAGAAPEVPAALLAMLERNGEYGDETGIWIHVSSLALTGWLDYDSSGITQVAAWSEDEDGNLTYELVDPSTLRVIQ